MLNITEGGLSGGYRKYLEHIIPGLAFHPDVSRLLVGMPETIDLLSWKERFPSVKWICLKKQFFPYQTIGSKTKAKVTQFSPDVIFIPTARFLHISEIPVVNMVRNMEPLGYINGGNPLSEKIKNSLRAALARVAVQKADRTIAISKFVRDFLERSYNIPTSKIAVIYHGVSQPHRINSIKPQVIPESLSGGFLFTAGSIRPARGLEDIISALKHLTRRDSHRIDALVIAGSADAVMRRYLGRLEKKVVKNETKRHILFTGGLNEQEMAWCYQNCLAFVMTSRVEACPNIALGAMSHGCLCISTDSPPLPEIFGETALYYPSKNPNVLAEVIQTVVSCDSRRCHQLSQMARRRAAEFSWDITVNKTVEQLRKAFQDRKYAETGKK